MVVISLLAVAMIGLSNPAKAMAFGTVDTVHAYVGAIVAQFPDGSFGWCSGNLVAPRVFLTAGHCTVFFTNFGASIGKIWVTFDTNIFPAGSVLPSTYPGPVSGFVPPAPDWIRVDAFIADPLLSLSVVANTNDLAVAILHGPATGIAPVPLAPVGLLDSLVASSSVVEGTPFLKVGYGLDENSAVTAQRRLIESPFQTLRPFFLVTQGGTTKGFGFGSFGDSGGPALLSVGGTVYLFGVNTFEYGTPQSIILLSYRVDVPSSQSFILGEIAANP